MIYKVYTDRYVAAVIEGTVPLFKWLSTVDERILGNLKIEPMTGQSKFPVTLVEYEFHGEVEFLHAQNPDRLKRDLTNLGRRVLCTYTIEKDFLGDPKNPGLDYMGVLDHDHEEEE